jgi:pimeloyl-ACP methyl ester carboxylesterase
MVSASATWKWQVRRWHLHGAGGFALSPAHDLLAQQFRIVAFEMPGFGASPENTKTQSMPELAATMAAAADQLGLDRYNLMGTSFGGKTALWLALQQPERVLGLVLESPAAIRPEGAAPPPSTPKELARRLYAYPDRQPPAPAVNPAIRAQTQKLVARLRGPDRDRDLETQLSRLKPTLRVRHPRRDDPARDGAFTRS